MRAIQLVPAKANQSLKRRVFMKPTKHLLIFASILLLLAFAAPALAGGVKPCELITKDDAAAILGEPVKNPRTGRVQGMATGVKCDYYTAAPMSKRGGVGLVQLIVFTKATMKDGAFSSPQDYFARLQKAGKKAGSSVEDIAGLGDKAYWNPRGNVLHIMAGGMYLQFRVSDLKKIKVKGGRAELKKAVSEHRKKLTVSAAKKYLMPKL
jgi:hypothetical protein